MSDEILKDLFIVYLNEPIWIIIQMSAIDRCSLVEWLDDWVSFSKKKGKLSISIRDKCWLLGTRIYKTILFVPLFLRNIFINWSNLYIVKEDKFFQKQLKI